MVPPDVEKSWYTALFEEDCLSVKRLLGEHRELLKVGWKSDRTMTVEGSPDNYWKPRVESPWKGRTALHVGARRGDVELVQQVLKLCDITDVALLASRTAAVAIKEFFPKKTTANKSPEEGEAAADDWGRLIHSRVSCAHCSMEPIRGPRFRKVESWIFSRLQEIIRPESNLCLKCFEGRGAEDKDGYIELYPLAGRKQRKPDQLPNLTLDSAQENSSTAPIQSAQAKGDAAEKKGKDIAIASNDGTGSEDHQEAMRESGQARQKYKASIANMYTDHERRNVKPIAGFSDYFVPQTELRELLLSKDGQYELDALAMAQLHGNVDIIVLLVYALGECDGSPYGIRRNDGFSPQAVIENDSTQRIELTKVTKGIVDHLRKAEPLFMAACEEEYCDHRDFNFLPLEEYLFHFCWTSRFQECFHEEHKELLRDSFFVRLNTRKAQQDEEEKADEKQHHNERQDEEEKADELQHQNELWRFVMKLHDGQGRTSMHVATEESTLPSFYDCIDRLSSVLVGATYLNLSIDSLLYFGLCAFDGSGKLPVHRAAAMGSSQEGEEKAIHSWVGLGLDPNEVWFRGMNLKRANEDVRTYFDQARRLMAEYCELRIDPISEALGVRGISSFDLSELSKENGFRGGEHYGSNPLQAAIIHNSSNFRWLLGATENDAPETKKNVYYTFNYNASRPWSANVTVDIMELICFVGADVNWVRDVLEAAGDLHKAAGDKPSHRIDGLRISIPAPCPKLHLVASLGNYEILKLFLAASSDHFVEDRNGNTALHCVMKDEVVDYDNEAIEFRTHLLDYVSCKHLLMKDQRRRTSEKNPDDTDKKGSVDLLLQAGFDIFKANKQNQVPFPGGRVSSSATFVSWWYEKQAKEFAAMQNSLNNEANAISVTATLVATASFVGPLQPPRGYTEDNQVDYENRFVAIFVFCCTFSFYLAIVAIVLSLIPSLPMPQQAMFKELRRTRHMVTLAVAVLFPSIVSVHIAFASGSIAVVGPRITSSLGTNLAVTSVSIGGLLTVVAFFLFLVRLLGICLPRNSWIRYLYKRTSF